MKREIEVTYTNMTVDDIILELARYIDKGFSVASWNGERLYTGENKDTFTLIERHKI